MKKDTRYLGLDVHAESISAAIAEGRGKVRSLGKLPNSVESVRKFIKKLGDLESLRVCYEAGPTGYALYWQLTKIGVDCEVVAPSLIPKKAGDRVKTDRRDAQKLAECFQSGTLTAVWVPDGAHEALRDLVRGRGAAKTDETRAKHRLTKYLLRYGMRPPNASRAWSRPWWTWIQSLQFEHESQNVTLADYLAEVVHSGERLARLDLAIDKAIEKVAPEKKAVIDALQSIRGIAKLSAVTIVTEVGTFQRFRKATELMAYTGLVPSEYSSGGRQAKGKITKTGNARLRRILCESAWHARHRPWMSKRLKQLLPMMSPQISAAAWTSQQRLHRKFAKMTAQHKPPGKVAAAVAREMVGFIWAIGRLAETPGQVQTTM